MLFAFSVLLLVWLLQILARIIEISMDYKAIELCVVARLFLEKDNAESLHSLVL